jgi:chorismate synthase
MEFRFQLGESNPVRCPDPETAAKEAYIEHIRSQGDYCRWYRKMYCKNVPIGLENQFYEDKLHASLGQAMLSINAVRI